MIAYTTRYEESFIMHLGRWSENAHVHSMSRAALLRAYIAAARLRVRWGYIKQDIALACAEEQLAIEEGRSFVRRYIDSKHQ